ncbi:MAG: DUF3293 domain-containing protein [Azonexus sp.]|nr:DUF3293 domain-containing protein [Azonexus sp.]
MARSNELEAAYRACTYRVFLPEGLVELHIDRPSTVLADWLAMQGHASFALITAHNPGGQQVPAEKNAGQQSALECDLLEGNYEPYGAEHVALAADWPVEESCFVPDILLEDALALAEDYGQDAIVWGQADGIPRLAWVTELGQ